MNFAGGAKGVDIDPEIGTLKMIMKSWNVSDETKGKITFEPIKTRKCNEDDFNDLEGSNS